MVRRILAAALFVSLPSAGGASTHSVVTQVQRPKLEAAAREPVEIEAPLRDSVIAVKVFQVFGDTDQTGDGSSSKAGSRSRSKFRKRAKARKRLAPTVAPDAQPPSILQLLDASCEAIKM